MGVGQELTNGLKGVGHVFSFLLKQKKSPPPPHINNDRSLRPYATASSSGQGDFLRCPENDSAKSEKSSDDDVKERTPETSTATKKRKTVASSSTTPKKPRLGSGGRNECLAWFKDYAEQKRVEQEAQREKAEKHHRDKMELLSGILGVLKDLNK